MIKIRVPATTANLGVGFDCAGLALSLYNDFTFKEGKSNVEPDNLILKSFNKLYEYIGKDAPEVAIEVIVSVPQARGLGSSATCIAGGLIGAREMSGVKISDYEILKLATEIEGHPDNVAPAIFGGLIVSIKDKEIIYRKFEPTEELNFYVLIPDFELSTKKAREVLPKTITLKQGVSNAARTAMLPYAYEHGDMEIIKTFMKDEFHEKYREPLIPNFKTVREFAIKNNFAAFISGAGPSILCVSKEKIQNNLEELVKDFQIKFNVMELNVSEGYRVIK